MIEKKSNQNIIPKLEIVDLNFSYANEEQILSDFSLLVNDKQFVSVVGDSGVGKTTLFRTINGLEKINQGYIRLDGFLQSSSFFHLPPEKRPIGTIFQDYALFPHLSVEKNIKYSLNKSNHDKKFYDDIISLLRVDELLDRYIDELSGGQKQRIALARSLVRKPKLVLIDGNKIPIIKNYKLKNIIKGDEKIPEISAASIIAKVSRDRLVNKMSKKFTKYSWHKNAGYGTKDHLRAIKKFG